MTTTYWHEIESPIGPLMLAGDGERLSLIHFQAGPRPRGPELEWRADPGPFRAVIEQLGEYFAGARQRFELALAPRGTEFQRRVWQALTTIPYGTTISYRELAYRVGNLKASRAVGLANGANPLPVIVPCHRVIGADGSLTGFGGGLDIKRRLLGIEGWRQAEARPRRRLGARPQHVLPIKQATRREPDGRDCGEASHRR